MSKKELGFGALTNLIKTASLAVLLACATTPFALAQTVATSSIDQPKENGDWAIAFINFLFRGMPLPESLSAYGTRLMPVADALGRALAIYSLAMLVLAGIVLFYHLAAMIVSTAHDGVVLGRRTNQIWAPIRLVVAVALLVPVGSSLSSGQFIVLKIAASGSLIASHAWSDMTHIIGDNFSTLVTPNGPDTGTLAARAVEMELCRQIYIQAFTPLENDPTMRGVGNIGDINKIPPGQISVETWRYSNLLNGATPLCGEYRFDGFRRHGSVLERYSDNTTHMADDLSTFSHSEADSLMGQTRSIAAKAAPIFSTGNTPTVLDIQDDIKTVQKSLKNDVDARLQDMATVNAEGAQHNLTLPSEAGWIAAASFIPELVRLQETFGELADHMLPEIGQPIFAHTSLTQQALSDAIAADPGLRSLDHTYTDPIFRLYLSVSHINGRGLDWFYNSQMDDTSNILITEQDLREQFALSPSSGEAFGLFGRAIDVGAVVFGVWGMVPGDNDFGNPFSVVRRTSLHNPFTTMIEFGHRQLKLGVYLAGLAGGTLSLAPASAAAIISGILSLALLAGGLLIMFGVPFLPFFRFLLAVLVWLLELFEAVAAIPLVALAHLTPSGEGLSGSTARQAYLLWTALLIRPVLTVLGFSLGLLLFTLGMSLTEIALQPIAHMASTTNSGLFLIVNVAVVILYDLLAIMVANVAFKGITLLPNQALRWLSPFVVTESKDIPVTTPAAASTLSTTSSTNQITTGYVRQPTGSSAAGAVATAGNSTNNSLFPISERTGSDATSRTPAAYAEKSSTVYSPSAGGVQTASQSTQNAAAAPAPGMPSGGGATPGAPKGVSQADLGNGSPNNPFKNQQFFANKDKPNA